MFRIHEEPSSGPEKKRGVLQAKMDGRVCGAAETSDPLQGEAVRALLRAVGGEKEHEPEQPGNAAEQETVERLREKFLESLRVSG